MATGISFSNDNPLAVKSSTLYGSPATQSNGMRTIASSNLSRWRLGLNSAFQIASSTVTNVKSTAIGPVLRIVNLNHPASTRLGEC